MALLSYAGMLLFLGNRHLLMQPLAPRRRIVELGVHRGENAELMRDIFKPERMLLIDSWSAQEMKKGYSPFDELPSYVLPISTFKQYFGGDPTDQTTLDTNYAETRDRFSNDSNIEIMRASSNVDINEKFDLIYIDANHQYEYVLRDLMIWKNRLDTGGIIMMNDCIYSHGGRNQNLGVLPATTNFLKYEAMRPVAFTARDFADLVIMRDDEHLKPVHDAIVSTGRVIELPDVCLANAHTYKDGDNKILSFDF